jgi:hypothetical protein
MTFLGIMDKFMIKILWNIFKEVRVLLNYLDLKFRLIMKVIRNAILIAVRQIFTNNYYFYYLNRNKTLN